MKSFGRPVASNVDNEVFYSASAQTRKQTETMTVMRCSKDVEEPVASATTEVREAILAQFEEDP